MADCNSTLRPPFAHLIATLNGPPPAIDPAAQARECADRAREFLSAARRAREYGLRKRSAQYLLAARMMRFALGNWRERARDAAAGMAWFNSITETERRVWLDIAWRGNQKTSGRAGYSVEDMPSAADAWAAFKRVAP